MSIDKGIRVPGGTTLGAPEGLPSLRAYALMGVPDALDLCEQAQGYLETVLVAPPLLMEGMEPLLTSQEAAKLLRVTPRTIRRWGHAGRIRAVWLSPRTVRYTASSVEALLQGKNAS